MVDEQFKLEFICVLCDWRQSMTGRTGYMEGAAGVMSGKHEVVVPILPSVQKLFEKLVGIGSMFFCMFACMYFLFSVLLLVVLFSAAFRGYFSGLSENPVVVVYF